MIEANGDIAYLQHLFYHTYTLSHLLSYLAHAK